MTSRLQSYIILVMLVIVALSNFRLTSATSQRQREAARRRGNVHSGIGYSDHETDSGASLRHTFWSPSSADLSAVIVRSDVNHRFATTTVTHRILNSQSAPNTTAVFEYVLPKTALVVNFTAMVDGRLFIIGVGNDEPSSESQTGSGVRQRESSLRGRLDDASHHVGNRKLRHLLASSGDRQPFRAVLPLSAGGRAEFNLTYQELLVRTLGTYALSIALPSIDDHVGGAAGTSSSSSSSMTAREMRVDIRIKESNEITSLHVIPPQSPEGTTGYNSTEDNPQVRARRVSSNIFHVTYVPTATEQSRWRAPATGRGGHQLLTVRYDVRHQLDAGEIQIKDGYFVHQFSPVGLQPIVKNVVFVLDASGSMSGTKMANVIDAMIDILDELHPDDTFNVVSFGTDIRYFNNETCVSASSANVGNAKSFLSSMHPAGGANMNDALLRAVEFLVRQEEIDPLATHVSMILLVTNGRPTRGITEPTRILTNVRQASGSRICIFPVGVGLDVDFRFLDQLAQQNRGGSAARILLPTVATTTDDSGNASGDISVGDLHLVNELRSFCRQVASPLLKNVRVRYDDVIDESTLTDLDFPAYFEGQEIVVAGKLKTGVGSRSSSSSGGGQYVTVKVSGGSMKGYMSLDIRVKTPRATSSSAAATGSTAAHETVGRTASTNGGTERVWAYLTVRRLLRKAGGSSNSSVGDSTVEMALQAASRHLFITPYSPVVLREVVSLPGRSSSVHHVFYKDLDAEIADQHDRDRAAANTNRHNKGTLNGQSVAQRGQRPTSMAPTSVPIMFAENDPHFIVSVKGLSSAVCFDVTGVPGNVYQLIHDRRTGIVVNAMIVAKEISDDETQPLSSPIQHKQPTYIGQISVIHGPCSTVVGPQSVQIDNVIYQWPSHNASKSIRCGQLMIVEILGKRHVTVTVQSDVVLRVLRHGVSESHPFKVDFLGFYVERGSGLSEFTHGLIGQFIHQEAKTVTSSLDLLTSDHDDTVRLATRLSFSGPHSSHRTVRAVMMSRRDMQHKAEVACWHVDNEGAGLLRGTVEDYAVEDLLDRRLSFHHIVTTARLSRR